MMRFLFGVIIGILLFFFFLYFGGGKTVKKIGEDLTETGKKMEVMEEQIRKGKDDLLRAPKKLFKEEKGIKKKSQ